MTRAIHVPKITYQNRDDDGYVVFADGDRIGIVRHVGGAWHAADTFFVGLRDPFDTRKRAAGALLRRYRRQVKEGRVS
jgi:hypothetical protein